MKENFNDVLKQLKVTLAANSYPALKEIKYFRDYNSYIEESFNKSKNELEIKSEEHKNTVKLLDLGTLNRLSEKKKINEFSNIMRISLLTAVCSFLEKVIKIPCEANGRKNKYKKHPNVMKLNSSDSNFETSFIKTAKDFLFMQGFNQINNIQGWDYIEDMMRIRNKFVHEEGRADSQIKSNLQKYDYSLVDGEIILGDQYIENFITVAENFSMEFAKLFYVDEGFISKHSKK